MKKISILVPVYNELNLFEKVLDNIISFVPINSIEKEIIIIDDFSSDGTKKKIKEYEKKGIKTIYNDKNYGKGYSLRKGIEQMTGDYFVVHDSDLEYETNEINKLIEVAIINDADVVYGSRFLLGNYRRILFFWHTIGNKFLTILSNFLSNLNLSDMETCYKLIKTDVIKKIELKENRFGFEPEITAKIGNLHKNIGLKIYEIGVSYNGRTYKEGKKINWKDGFSAIRCIIRYNLFN
jgi:glycosyltransferase involved in cell wall biosynthesis